MSWNVVVRLGLFVLGVVLIVAGLVTALTWMWIVGVALCIIGLFTWPSFWEGLGDIIGDIIDAITP